MKYLFIEFKDLETSDYDKMCDALIRWRFHEWAYEGFWNSHSDTLETSLKPLNEEPKTHSELVHLNASLDKAAEAINDLQSRIRERLRNFPRESYEV